jgi:hypothetical protein
MAMVAQPIFLARLIARSTFGESPLVLMPTTTSPGLAAASSWRSNTRA